METLSVIVPCYNEEEVITESYSRLKKVLDGISSYQTEIIFINDGSKDRTAETLSDIAATDKQVKVLHFSRNFGHQPAVTAGIHYCTSDLAVIIDADLQDPPELIPELIETLKRDKPMLYIVSEKNGRAKVFLRNSLHACFIVP